MSLILPEALVVLLRLVVAPAHQVRRHYGVERRRLESSRRRSTAPLSYALSVICLEALIAP